MKIAWWWGIFVCLSLSSCATLQQEREDRFMPRATNPPEIRNLFVTEYAVAIQEAQAAPNRTNIKRMVDTGSALSALNCGAWVDKNILVAQGILMTDNTAAAVGAATTIAAGAFSFSPGAVAGVGVAQMIAHLFGQVEKTGLGAPDSFQAQSTMLSVLASCSDTLLVQANSGGMSFSQALLGIDRCRRFCSPGAASAITTQALMQNEVVVQPSGALMLVPKR